MKRLIALIISFLIWSHISWGQEQEVRFFADVLIFGVGITFQDVTLGNHTQTENITGMSGLCAGVNIPLGHNFEISPSAGFLLKLNFNSSTSYSSSGTTHSTESSTFFVPKIGVEFSRAFIFSETKFVQGIKLGGGPEYYWPGKLDFRGNNDDLTVDYANNAGYFVRCQLVFRSFGKLQLIPHLTYRHVTFNANDYQQGSLDQLHSSLRTLKVRNIELGLMLLL